MENSTELTELQKQLAVLTEKVAELENKLLLVADVYRYEKLQKYLAISDWFEADLETIKVISDITGKEPDNITPEDIQKFPANELRVIDRLWRKYSNDHFGFAPQVRIYKKMGGNLETTIAQNRKLVEDWGDQLGWRDKSRWRKCDELDYSLNAPLGCHPSQWWNSAYGSKMTNYFLGRLIACNI